MRPGLRSAWSRLAALVLVLGIIATTGSTFACGARSELFDDSFPLVGSEDAGQAAHPDAGGASGLPEAGVPLSAMSDAGGLADAVADAWLSDVDASYAAPCLAGGNVFFVDGEGGYPGISGVQSVTGAQGTWGSVIDGESELQLNVAPADNGGEWVFSTGSDTAAGLPLLPGTFESSGRNVFVQVGVDGRGCGNVPTGPFTIAEISYPYFDQSTLTSILVWFDLRCGDAGALRGCVSYGR